MRRRLFASLSLALVLAFPVLAPAAEQPLDRIVAVVNDDAIMASELRDRVAQARSQLADRNIAMPSGQALRQQVLDRMIGEQIQLQMAEEVVLVLPSSLVSVPSSRTPENIGANPRASGERWTTDTKGLQNDVLLEH